MTDKKKSTNKNKYTNLIEYIPIMAFAVGYIFKDILFATELLVIFTIAVVPLIWRINGRAPLMQIFTALLVGFFGGLSLYLNDPDFIKMKPTFASLIFAVVLIVSMYFNKLPLKSVMGKMLIMQDKFWRVLSIRIAIYFFTMAILNEYIWRNYSEAVWVNFKIFGFVVGYLIFMLLQIRFIKKHAKSE